MGFAMTNSKGDNMDLLDNRELLRKKAKAWEVLNTTNGGVVSERVEKP